MDIDGEGNEEIAEEKWNALTLRRNWLKLRSFTTTISYHIIARVFFRVMQSLLRKISLFLRNIKKKENVSLSGISNIPVLLPRAFTLSFQLQRNSSRTSSKRQRGSGDSRSRSFPSFHRETISFTFPLPLRGRGDNSHRFCFRNIRCVTPVSSNVRPSYSQVIRPVAFY